MCVEVINSMADTIVELEKKLAEREWIPVSERLPDTSRWVLVTAWLGKDKYQVYTAQYYDGQFWNAKGYKFTHGVTAWCELPEPYKGEEA